MRRCRRLATVAFALAGCVTTAPLILPEERQITPRDPAQFPSAALPDTPPPRTVSDPQPGTTEWKLSLDEAIRIALENARVVRVLAGVTAVSSGQTIYDPAISNTTIDQEQARFDPALSDQLRWNRSESASAIGDPFNPLRSILVGGEVDQFRHTFGLSQTNLLGGQAGLNWLDNYNRFGSGSLFPLNPEHTNAVELSYTQPLLQGGGFRVNAAPIVIARLNTERSFFQYKDSVQELVRGVIEGYWNLVQARTDVWARRIQVQQSEEAYNREKARLASGLADLSNVAQARVTFAQFKANLIAAEATALSREGALRNLLGLPPGDCRAIVPVSVPTDQRLRPNWCDVVRLAEQRRPDVVELKIILEAEQVRLAQAENAALPRLDAVGLYRFNGLAGEMPTGEQIATGPGRFNDWTLGINFSVPLGLRQGRALVRQTNLLIARDRANIEQAVHAATHELAATTRDLDNAYEQYRAYVETRAAALENLKVQTEQFNAGRAIYLNVLQALNDWGNAVSSEARALLSYNVLLANLERQTGTILETHGMVFYEERFRAAGPLLRERCYPSAIFTTGDPTRYPGGVEPSENSFDLRNPNPSLQRQK